ncbi:MAG: DUF6445 family protein [Dongiaceae bacterium]
MNKTFIVLDDIYDDPHQIRAEAARMMFPDARGTATYAGRNSSAKYLLPDTDKMISWAAGEPLTGATDRAHGAFRLTLAGDIGRFNVHVDVGVDWSGVLFLTLPEHCRGGTSFLRHRHYGTDHAPLTRAELATYGVDTPDAALDLVLGQDSNDPDKWETAMTVPMRFNRMVLFRPLMWHAAGEGFGDDFEYGRLVQLFFLRRAP